MGKPSTAAKQKYNERVYDRIFVTVPKGLKDEYAAKAKEAGMSLNALINKLLEEYKKTPAD